MIAILAGVAVKYSTATLIEGVRISPVTFVDSTYIDWSKKLPPQPPIIKHREDELNFLDLHGSLLSSSEEFEYASTGHKVRFLSDTFRGRRPPTVLGRLLHQYVQVNNMFHNISCQAFIAPRIHGFLRRSDSLFGGELDIKGRTRI